MAHQRGRIYEASGKLYVQYRATVNGERKQVSHFLCVRDDLHRSKSDRSVKLLRDEFILTVNSKTAQASAAGQDMSIADFWERYVQRCEEVLPLTGRPRKKPSTMRGYKQIWNQHLKSHFGNLTLQEYEPYMGTKFLQGLACTHRKKMLGHIRGLGSSLFKRAVLEERVKVNPWHDVEMPEDAIESPRTPHYTWPEAEDVISALVDHVDCQLIMALACFLGLRPNEIAPLRWEDFDEDWLHIRRGYVRGKLDVPKTPESVAPVPLIDRVRVPLVLWRQRCGNPSEGWLFPSTGTLPAERIIAPEMKHLAGGLAPVDLSHLIQRIIRPALEANHIPWKPLKAGRTGACTAVIEKSGGNYALAQQLLRHKSMKTTLDIYKKGITPEAFQTGMKLLES